MKRGDHPAFGRRYQSYDHPEGLQKFQTFSFPPTLTNYVMLFIESVYPGDKWTDTCISEIKVFAE